MTSSLLCGRRLCIIIAVTVILFLPVPLGHSPIIVDVSAQTPHCISDGTGSYDPDWCWYERAVENHPRCLEIFNGYNAMVRASPLWPSNAISLVDPSEWCQLHPPDHPPPLLKSETPITGCESYTGSQYDDCINSQLDDTLKGVQDPCGDPSNPNYVKCLLGDKKSNKPYTPKIQRGQQLGLGPCTLENPWRCYDDPVGQDEPYYDDEICDEYPETCPPFSRTPTKPNTPLFPYNDDYDDEEPSWLCRQFPNSTFCQPPTHRKSPSGESPHQMLWRLFPHLNPLPK